MPITEEIAPYFTDELRSDPVVSKYYEAESTNYKSVPDVLKTLAHSQKQLGNTIPLYNKESAKPEDIERWRNDNNAKLKERGFAIAPLTDLARIRPGNVPASPDAYEFKFGEGVTPEQVSNDQLLKEFRSYAHKKGYSNEEAADMVSWFAEKAAPLMAQNAPEIERGQPVVDILTGVFKEKTPQVLDDYRKNVENLNRTIPGLKDYLEESPAWYGDKLMASGDHPVMVQLINLYAELTRPDFAGYVAGGTSLNPDANGLISEANDIMHNPENPKHKLYLNNDKATVDYVSNLFIKADNREVTL